MASETVIRKEMSKLSYFVWGIIIGPIFWIALLDITGHFHHYMDRLYCVW